MVRAGRLQSAYLLAVAIATGCGDDSNVEPDAGPRVPPPAAQNPNRELVRTDLVVDVLSRAATATIQIAPDDSLAATFEIGDLDISSVSDSLGPLNFVDRGDRLDIGVPAVTGELTIEYSYRLKNQFDGVLTNGLTLTWPYYCGNIFPCKSGPDDGLEFSLELDGVAAGETAVYPSDIPADSPSYMLAWAVGDYEYVALGTTPAGTEVGTYASAAQAPSIAAGAANLVGVFDWLETNLGGYIFGDKVASVAAEWGPSGFGGMEHHPLWHVATGSLGSEDVHAHEAAHGWFGNGVRIACWEDFVLSEGTVSYLAARSLEEVAGSAVSDPIWASYRRRLDGGIAWPEGCNEIDILADGLFSNAPYVKGALFFRSLEARIGRPALDAALASFYLANRGSAARMSDLLAEVASQTGYDPMACATAWLRAVEIPAAEVCP